MNLKKHLDRAEQALEKGQPDFAAELCDQVLDFAPVSYTHLTLPTIYSV